MAGAEGIQWLLTVANTINTVGDIMDKLKGVHDRLPDVVKQHITEVLAGNTKESRKSVRDEILYGAAVYSLNVTESPEVSAFETRLRKNNAPKAEAFVLFVAKGVEEFRRENKKTTTPKRGTSGPSVEQAYNTFGEGLSWAGKFLRELISQKGANDQETFTKRVAFLKGKNVFSLIPPKKEPLPIVVKAKKIGKDIVEEVGKSQQGNITDLTATTTSWVDRARTWRDATPNRG